MNKNFLNTFAFVGMFFIGISLILGLFNLTFFNHIASIIAFSVTAIVAYNYVKFKKKTWITIVYLVTLVLIAALLIWPIIQKIIEIVK